MSLQAYLGRLTIGNDSKDFTLTAGGALALTTGRYYMSGYTGESTVQLVEHIEDVIIALGGGYAAARVSLSADGFVTIDLGTPDELTWTDTDLRDLLGYDATLTGGQSYTAPNQARYTWYPDKDPSSYPGDLTRVWMPNSTSIAYRSADGTTYTAKGALLYDAVVEYSHLDDDKVRRTNSNNYSSLERFFEDVIHQGEPFRIFPDRTTQSSTADYVTAMWADQENAPIGSFQNLIGRNIRAYNGLWQVEMLINKWVEPTSP